jgi:metal-dependent amidase/aminoacylase/carboxypeptidase family protein
MHPIIANGCGAVNAIPDSVVLENAVRGASIEAIIRENKKVNRAVVGSALSLGANVTLRDRPGYMPVKTDIGMREAALEACSLCFGRENVIYPKPHGPACTDMGDLTTLIPTVYMLLGGATGLGHGNNYYVPDELGFCMNSARLLLTFVDLVLGNNAERANKIISEFQPIFENKEAYIRTLESMVLDAEAITYGEDSSAVVRYHKE